jgi:hypothetical protein
LTAASGLQTIMQCLGQYHDSGSASWDILERGADFCKVRGRMAKLPVTLDWDLRLEEARLVWRVSCQVEQDLEMNDIKIWSFWPSAYGRWFYGDLAGDFPEIAPQDLVWQMFRPRAPYSMEAGAAPAAGSELPPLAVLAESEHPYISMLWGNTDYVAGSRILEILAHLPMHDNLLRRGTYDLMTVEFRTEASVDVVRRHFAERTQRLEAGRVLTSGKLRALFDGGNVHYAYDGAEVTSFLHFYSSAFMSSLWNDSHDLQWSFPRLSDGRLDITGESRRFPYRQHWEIEAVEDGIATRIWLEAIEPVDMNEYHASIVLKEEYNRWETPFERGEYPEFEAGQEDWRHVNHVYSAGTFARAFSPTLPPVTLSVGSGPGLFRMTVINTGCHERSRVLQALRTPDAGLIHFEPGRHLYFEGRVTVGENGLATDVKLHEGRDSL